MKKVLGKVLLTKDQIKKNLHSSIASITTWSEEYAKNPCSSMDPQGSNHSTYAGIDNIRHPRNL